MNDVILPHEESPLQVLERTSRTYHANAAMLGTQTQCASYLPRHHAAVACHDIVQSMKGLGGFLTIAGGRASIGTAAGGGVARSPGLLSLSMILIIIL
jgi:hypothetical protein